MRKTGYQLISVTIIQITNDTLKLSHSAQHITALDEKNMVMTLQTEKKWAPACKTRIKIAVSLKTALVMRTATNKPNDSFDHLIWKVFDVFTLSRLALTTNAVTN